MAAVQLSSMEALVVGTSTGGVEALLALLSALPRGFRPAVLVVIHRRPEEPGTLADLLAPRCALPVSEALDKQPVARGAVLLAPPNYHLLVEPTKTLALSMDPPVRFSRPSIDLLFESASIAYTHRVLALLLTGSNEDGSDGLAAIRRRGGKAWVQDPATARASTMPAAGLAFAGADEVLSLPEMCRRLALSSDDFLENSRVRT